MVQKLDTVKCKGLQFESQQFQNFFGQNFFMDTLGLSEVLPLDLADNSKLVDLVLILAQDALGYLT